MPEDKQQKNKNIYSKTEFVESNEPKNFKDRFMDIYYDVIPLFMINLVWFLLSLPVVTIFSATGGLYYATLALERENSADWSTVWAGFKKHWWLSLKWGLLVLFGYILISANIWFYLNLNQVWTVFALTISIMALIIWTVVTQFSFPLLLLQKDKKIFLALKNGYVIVMRKPLSALKVVLISSLTTIISILLPPLWIFVSMAWIIRMQTKTVLQAVEEIQQKEIKRETEIANLEESDTNEDQEEYSFEK